MLEDVGLRVEGEGPLGITGEDTVVIDRNVRVGCQHGGRPTTTGHDRGPLSPWELYLLACGAKQADARTRLCN